MNTSCEVAALHAVRGTFHVAAGRAASLFNTLALAGALTLTTAVPAAHSSDLCKTQWTPGMCKLVHVLEVIEARHADATVADKLVVKVMDHLAKEIDPYSNYYDVEAYRELRRNLEGRRVETEIVSHRLLPGARAYVHLRTFSEATAEKLVEALNDMAAASPKPLTGVVLDLRDNPGGLVRAAVAVAAAFLPRNALVITTRGDGLEAAQEFRAAPGDYTEILGDGDALENLPETFRSLPITVLVNRGSASASEILAAALQDHRRATIIGTRTFGKGTVQTIIPLEDDTAIKFTTSFFYTPKGRKVDGQGVTPDLVIKKKPAAETVTAAQGQVAQASPCVLQASAGGLRDLEKLSGDDRTDCQLQQALVTLGNQRLAQAR